MPGCAERSATELGYTFFDGLVSDIGAFVALGQDGASAAVDRLASLAEPDGWPQSVAGPPRALPDARISDATLGTASIVLGTLWADRQGVAAAREVLEKAAVVLLSEAEGVEGGVLWRFIPVRFRPEAPTEMPNWSHGQAGIVAAVALAGHHLGRPDLVDAARRGAEHLVRLGTVTDDGFVVPHYVFPPDSEAVSDEDEFAWGWCHGASGTSLSFAALKSAGADSVAGSPPGIWQRRCLEGRTALGRPGSPPAWLLGQRRPVLRNGRCRRRLPGLLTARSGDEADPDFALLLAVALVERAEGTADHLCRSSSTAAPTRCSTRCRLDRARPGSPHSSSRPRAGPRRRRGRAGGTDRVVVASETARQPHRHHRRHPRRRCRRGPPARPDGPDLVLGYASGGGAAEATQSPSASAAQRQHRARRHRHRRGHPAALRPRRRAGHGHRPGQQRRRHP